MIQFKMYNWRVQIWDEGFTQKWLEKGDMQYLIEAGRSNIINMSLSQYLLGIKIFFIDFTFTFCKGSEARIKEKSRILSLSVFIPPGSLLFFVDKSQTAIQRFYFHVRFYVLFQKTKFIATIDYITLLTAYNLSESAIYCCHVLLQSFQLLDAKSSTSKLLIFFVIRQIWPNSLIICFGIANNRQLNRFWKSERLRI